MRAILQRCTSASVAVDGKDVGNIGKGLMVLVGIGRCDTDDDVQWILKKILTARLWDGDNLKPWGHSAGSLGLDLLFISQFTLHGSLRKPKPDFHRSLGPEPAAHLFARLVSEARRVHTASAKVETGRFGEMMEVSLTNSGPVTLIVDSKNRTDSCFEDEGPGASPSPSFNATEASSDPLLT